jgi:Zn-finger protein
MVLLNTCEICGEDTVEGEYYNLSDLIVNWKKMFNGKPEGAIWVCNNCHKIKKREKKKRSSS